jgi:hypothetical protein
MGLPLRVVLSFVPLAYCLQARNDSVPNASNGTAAVPPIPFDWRDRTPSCVDKPECIPLSKMDDQCVPYWSSWGGFLWSQIERDYYYGDADMTCVCEFLAYSPGCQEACSLSFERTHLLHWINTSCSEICTIDNSTGIDVYKCSPNLNLVPALLPDNWTEYIGVLPSDMRPWSWTIYPPNQEQCYAAAAEKLGAFAVVNILVGLTIPLLGRRSVIHKITFGVLGRPGSAAWVFLGPLAGLLHIASNIANAALINRTTRLSTGETAQLVFLWTMRPRLSWLVALALVAWTGQRDQHITSSASIMLTELVLQVSSVYAMGHVANHGRRQGFYKADGRLNSVTGGQDAQLMYAGAILWLVLMVFSWAACVIPASEIFNYMFVQPKNDSELAQKIIKLQLHKTSAYEVSRVTFDKFKRDRYRGNRDAASDLRWGKFSLSPSERSRLETSSPRRFSEDFDLIRYFNNYLGSGLYRDEKGREQRLPQKWIEIFEALESSGRALSSSVTALTSLNADLIYDFGPLIEKHYQDALAKERAAWGLVEGLWKNVLDNRVKTRKDPELREFLEQNPNLRWHKDRWILMLFLELADQWERQRDNWETLDTMVRFRKACLRITYLTTPVLLVCWVAQWIFWVGFVRMMGDAYVFFHFPGRTRSVFVTCVLADMRMQVLPSESVAGCSQLVSVFCIW